MWKAAAGAPKLASMSPTSPSAPARSHSIAVLPGDGIGPEVVAEAVKVLDAMTRPAGVTLEKTSYPLGAEHWLETGEVLNEDTMERLRSHDAILFGAVGAAPNDKRIPSGILERDLLLKLRFGFDHYINLRPAVLYPGATSPLSDPGEIDFVVVREGTEGLYAGNGGTLRTGTEHEIATEVSVNTAHGVRRLVRYAFDLANSRTRKRLTLVHKHNVLVNAGRLYQRTVDEIGEQYPDVTVNYMHIDAATIFMTTDPARFDVIVTDNLFGDILSDAAAMLTGSLGMLPSASLGAPMANGRPKALYEPVHGSAPDIAGQGIANPIGQIWSGAMMLEHLGEREAAAEIVTGIERVLAERTLRTRDLGGNADTQACGKAVEEALG